MPLRRWRFAVLSLASGCFVNSQVLGQVAVAQDVSFEVPEEEIRFFTPEEIKEAKPVEELIDFRDGTKPIAQNLKSIKPKTKLFVRSKLPAHSNKVDQIKSPVRTLINDIAQIIKESITFIDSIRYTEFPERAVGKLTFFIGGAKGSCSAAAVTSPGENLIWTAGHCVSWKGSIHKNFVFTPAFSDNAGSFGSWKVCKGTINGSWHLNNEKTKDLAVLKACPVADGERRQVELHYAVGSLGFSTENSEGFRVAFGYPVKPNPPYDGGKMVRCEAVSSKGISTIKGDLVGMNCNVGTGASGGPWIINHVSDTWGGSYNMLNGIHAWTDPATQPGISSSPNFSAGDAARLYNGAVAKEW